jgi:hypothetical protein
MAPDLPAGRHFLEVALHGRRPDSEPELVGGEVAFFVHPVEASPFSMLERASTLDLAEKRAALVRWAQQHAEGFSKVHVDADDFGGNALFAAADIDENEVVGTIPYSMTFSPEGAARAGAVGEMLAHMYGDVRVPHEILSCMFLLSELQAGRESFFAPYLDLLPPPSSLRTPYYWDSDLRSLLSFDNRLVARVERQMAYFERAYARFFTVIEKLPAYHKSVHSKHFHLFARQVRGDSMDRYRVRCRSDESR